jgi:DNA-binding NarL/FixJ family response regulator
VIIADDHPSIRENLRYLLNAESDLQVVGVAGDGASALGMALELRPDVAVIDYDMPDHDGFSVARALRHKGSTARVVLYTMDADASAQAESEPIDAVVSKDAPPDVLLESIRGFRGRALPKPARVLVVEDDPDVRSVIRAALEDDGLEIIEAGDGFEALVEAERRPPGVVVLDLGLPGMSGQDFVTAYRHLPGKDAPIVVVSAIRDAREIATSLGAAAFLAKPFSIAKLSETVRRVAPT